MDTLSARSAATAQPTAWPVAGRLLDALTRRDFDALLDCLEPGVRFRALVPPGAFELTTAGETVARLRHWFDGPDEFEVVDASAGRVGSKTYVRWQIRMRTPGGTARVVEQHVYTTGVDRITTLDLLCSGFHDEPGVTS